MQSPRDENRIATLLGVSNGDGVTPVVLWADPVTHRLLTSTTGGNFSINEIVSGSGTTFTLANTPTAGTQQIYANGQRLTPGAGNDYTISGAVITLATTTTAGSILADYQY